MSLKGSLGPGEEKVVLNFVLRKVAFKALLFIIRFNKHLRLDL